MSATIDESEVHSTDKVVCKKCGSKVLLKNLRSHEKTAKCQNGGVVNRKGVPATTPTATVSIDALGNIKYEDPAKLQHLEAKKSQSIDEDDVPFEDFVEDSLDELHEKLDVIIKLITGEDLEDIKEEDEKAK